MPTLYVCRDWSCQSSACNLECTDRFFYLLEYGRTLDTSFFFINCFCCLQRIHMGIILLFSEFHSLGHIPSNSFQLDVLNGTDKLSNSSFPFIHANNAPSSMARNPSWSSDMTHDIIPRAGDVMYCKVSISDDQDVLPQHTSHLTTGFLLTPLQSPYWHHQWRMWHHV